MRLLVVGGICGLAWACGLRGFIAQVAGAESEVTWSGTFAWILAPGLLTGLMLGWAEHLRRDGGRRGWRWLALAPLALAAVLLPGLTDPANFLAEGIGGGALAVPLFGMAGGYAMSQRGPVAARVACGLLALAPIPIWSIVTLAQESTITPRSTWVALYFWSLLATLALASSIPHRPVPGATHAHAASRSLGRPFNTGTTTAVPSSCIDAMLTHTRPTTTEHNRTK
jgi:hypothetical protein